MKKTRADSKSGLARKAITHADRVIVPEDAVTKGELAAYYATIADWLWPHLAARPISLLRSTGNGQVFIQRHPVANAKMPGLAEFTYGELDAPYFYASTRAALHTFGQFTCVELHTWGSLARAPARPERLTFDLDPDPDLPWKTVRDAARLVRELLESLELVSFLKTTGGKGLHVVVPLSPPRPTWEEAAHFSTLVARHFARVFPERFSERAGAKNRRGRIFIDHLRNREAATTVAAYSPRYRPGVPVSMPLDWGDLGDEDLRGNRFNLRSAASHVSRRKRDPWSRYGTTRQRLLQRHARRLEELH